MFESLVEELIRRGHVLGKFSFSKIGRWWHKEREIDIVALNEETKEIVFMECKWQDKVDAVRILVKLKEKAAFVQWHNDKRKEHYAIFGDRYITCWYVFCSFAYFAFFAV